MNPRHARLSLGVSALCLVLLAMAGCGGETDPVDGEKNATESDVVIDVGQVDTGSSGGAVDSGVAPECAKKDDCNQPGTACMEANCVAGQCVTGPAQGECDDGDPCTQNDRCVGGGCVGVSAGCDCKSTKDCAGFEDGDLCNGTLFCDKAQAPFKCRVKPSTVVTCKPLPGSTSANGICAAAVCQPDSGTCTVIAKPDGTPCVDNDACTVDSKCSGGKCVGGSESWCQCKTSKDCAAFEDGDLCNGVLYCDKAVFPPRCRINTSSVVSCATNKNTACMTNTCNTKTGACEMVLAKDGAPCDPKSTCKNEGTCKTAGKLSTCTADVGICACEKNADCLDQEDGNYCNGTLYCDKAGTGSKAKGTCKPNPATTITCASVGDETCAQNKCVPTTGACVLQPTNAGKACDDGDACTKGEACASGKCKGGKDICSCKSDDDCKAKDDGNACNGTMFCNGATKLCELNPATIKSCPTVDDTDCKKNACDPKTGTCASIRADHVVAVKYVDGKIYNEHKPKSAPAKKNVPCDDGNACTEGDHCEATTCKAGKDTCICSKDADCAKQEDGNFCNGTLFCNKVAGKCIVNPKTVVVCPTTDDTACLTRACQPKSGKCLLSPRPFGTNCQDGNACTTADYCNKDGQCLGGKKVCACQSAADCIGYDDGNDCNGVVYCDKSAKQPKDWKCVPNNPATVVFCNPKDDTDCLANTCAAGKCVPKPRKDGTPCDDGTVCSKKSGCLAGKCAGSDKLVCNDNNACTLDTCDPKTGCVFAPKKNHCKDANACTVAACDPKTGNCTFDKKSRHGKACDADKDGCTVGDVCDNGTCKSGALVKCNVSTKPCLVATCQSKDSNNFQCVTTVAADGDACVGKGGACSLGGACKSGQCVQGALKKLWSRVVDPSPHMDMRATAVAGAGDRWLVAMTRVQKKTATQNIKAWWRFVTYSKSGKQATSVEKAVPADAGFIAGLVPATGGGHWAIGGSGGGKNAMWHIKDGAVGTIKALPQAVSGVKEWATGVASYSTGDIAVVGTAPGFKGAQTPVFKRVTQGGIVLGNSHMKSQKFKAEAVAIAENGVAFIVGAKDGPALGTQRAVVQVNQKYAFGGERAVGIEGVGASFYAVKAVAGGVVAAGIGWDKQASSRFGAVSKIDLAGNTVWDRSVGAGVGIASIGKRAGGGWLLVGRKSGQATKEDVWFGTADVDFNLHKEAVTYRAGDDSFAALLPLADGALAVGYVAVNQGTAWREHTLVSRLDTWGHASCSAAGDCAEKTAKDCDDGKACTRDACNSISGKCAHSAGDGFVCSGGGCAEKAACEKGACVPKGNERLWEKKLPGGYGLYSFGVAPRPDGSAAVVLYASGLGAKATSLVDVDRFGAVGGWAVSYNPEVRDVAPASNGDVVICAFFKGKFAYHNTWGLARVRRVNGKWSTVWQTGFSDSKSVAYGVRAFAMSDGTFGGLGVRNPSSAPRSIRWIRAHSNGAKIMAKAVPVPSGQSDWPYGAAVQPDTSVVIVGVSSGKALAVRLSNKGDQLWRRESGLATAYFDATAASGGAIAAGRIGPHDAAKPVLVMLTNDGKQRWLQKPKSIGDAAIVSVMPGANGVRALFREKVGFKTFASLRAFNSAGVQQWSNAIESGPFLSPRRMKQGADGAIWLVGETGDPNKPTPYVAKLSPWGDTSCAEAGKCFLTAATKCDDGDACTANTCDGKAGCSYAKTGCDDANACTTDACDKNIGCTHKATAAACDDGDMCTVKDACAGGFCIGKARICDDGNPCTDDSCDGTKGCVVAARKDGTSCPVSNGCSLSAVCASGKCAHSDKGKLWATAHELYNGGKAGQVVMNLAQVGGKWIGTYQQHTFGYPINLYAGHIDAAGGFKVHGNLAGGNYKMRVSSPVALEESNGGLLIAYGEGEADRRLRIRRYDKALKPQGFPTTYYLSTTTYGKHTYAYPRALIRLVDGSIASVGDVSSPSMTPRMDVQLVQSDLKAVWRRHVTSPGATVYARSGVPTATGGLVIGGWESRPKLGNAAVLHELDKAGKTVAHRAFHAAGSARIERLVRDGNDLIAAGEIASNGKPAPWLARFDGNGKRLWSRSIAQPSASYAIFLAKRPGGDGFIVAGTRSIGIGKATWLQHVDRLGNGVWRKDIQVGSSLWLSRDAARQLPDGGLLLGGGGIVGGSARGVIVRTDAWGHIACKDGGVCPARNPGAQVPKGCNDGKPCTADRCDAAKGCVHGPASCDDANPCTLDTCEGASGCRHQPKTGPCDDGSICTIGDTCKNGACSPIKTLDCSDGNLCTQDACFAVSGCQNVPLDGGDCDDGSKCAQKTTCSSGACVFGGPSLYRAISYDNSTDSYKYPAVHAGAVYGDDVVYGLPQRVYHWKWKNTDDYQLRFGRIGPRGKHFAIYGGKPTWSEGKALVTSQLASNQDQNSGVTRIRAFRHVNGGQFVAMRHDRQHWRYRDRIAIQFIDAVKVNHYRSARFIDPPYDSSKLHYTAYYYGDDLRLVVDGSMAIGGYRWVRSTGRYEVLYIRADGTGLPKHTRFSGRNDGDDFGHALVSFKTGHAVIAGSTRKPKGLFAPLLTRFDNSGKLVWRKASAVTGKSVVYRRIEHAASGMFAAGSYVDGSDKRYVLALHGDDGSLKWRKHPKLANPVDFRGVVISPDGSLLVAGDRDDGIVKKAWLSRITATGEPVWYREYQVGKTTFLGHQGLVGHGDGGATLLAGTFAFSRDNPAMIRVDAWGHASCAESGLCRTTKHADCAKKCGAKLALCDAKKGCTCK